MRTQCTRPIEAWYSSTINDTGKRSLVFDPKHSNEPDNKFHIPCQRCIGCRFEKSRQWAMRCVHEAKMHEDNCFLTLTFTDEELLKRENPWSVDKRDFQLFMKKLRKLTPKKIGYFHCGEYGEKNLRPHYHACIFNYDFDDKQFLKKSGSHNLYVSEKLNGTKFLNDNFPHLNNRINTKSGKRPLKGLWPYGSVIIGELTFNSAAYTARYVMKKINGQRLERML